MTFAPITRSARFVAVGARDVCISTTIVRSMSSNTGRARRALTQRLILVGSETSRFEVLGSTGNHYFVDIEKRPRCTCPDNRFRHARCKHIYFVLRRVLSCDDPAVYDAECWDDETLRALLDRAPVTDFSKHTVQVDNGVERRHYLGTECCICMEKMQSSESLLWCSRRCGYSFHAVCHRRWSAHNDSEVICPLCREPLE